MTVRNVTAVVGGTVVTPDGTRRTDVLISGGKVAVLGDGRSAAGERVDASGCYVHLALVRSIAQSAVVLRQGIVVEAGPVEQILEHPDDPYTRQLMEDGPRLAVGAAGTAGETGRPAAGSLSPQP